MVNLLIKLIYIDLMSSRTSPHENISLADTPPRPSRASPAPPIDLGAMGIAEMALPPTLHQEKNNPFPIDAARCEDYPQDPTSPHDNISPGDSPPRPSRASPAPPIDLGARGIAVGARGITDMHTTIK